MIPVFFRCTFFAALVAALTLPGSAHAGDPGAVACEPDYGFIQVLGDFNAWDPEAPGMTLIGTCLWADTLWVETGCHFMKFRTEGAWDDPPDYGRCEGFEGPCQVLVRSDGTPFTDLTCLVYGSGTALGEVRFPVTGFYEFLLDTSAPRSGQTYSIRFLDVTAPLGSISGMVAFTDDPPILPVATVTVFEAGAGEIFAVTHSSPGDGSFLIEELATGEYDLLIESDGYSDEALADVLVVAPNDTNVGMVLLAPGCASDFTAIQVLGGFNGWNEDTPSMDFLGTCVWADTLSIAPGCYFMKFRTEMAWGFPPDYGRCSGEEGPCQVTVPPDGTPFTGEICPVSIPTDALGEVEFLIAGEYEFRVDETTMTYMVRLLPGPVNVRTESWGQIKERYLE